MSVLRYLAGFAGIFLFCTLLYELARCVGSKAKFYEHLTEAYRKLKEKKNTTK